MNQHLLKMVVATTALLMFSLPVLSAEKSDEKKATEQKSREYKNKEQQDEVAVRLESVFVGDKEQPAISYFIPWQGIGAPDNLYWNVEEKYDNVLDLVDREIMLRSINIYDEMQLETESLSH